jgi:hypothetical protein
MNVKLRLYGFALAVVLLAALVGWAGNLAWQQLKQLRKNFGSVQSESFHLADHVESSVLNLNETVLRFDLRKDPADKAHFHKEGEGLKLWIQAQKPAVTTPFDLELLNQIEVALEAYLARTTHLLEKRAQAGSVSSSKEVLEQAENKGQILDLCTKLKAAERAALNQFVEDSREALGGTATTFDRLGGAGLDSGVYSHALDLQCEDCSPPRAARRKPRHYRATGKVGLARDAGRRRGP